MIILETISQTPKGHLVVPVWVVVSVAMPIAGGLLFAVIKLYLQGSKIDFLEQINNKLEVRINSEVQALQSSIQETKNENASIREEFKEDFAMLTHKIEAMNANLSELIGKLARHD
jgi:hypothetical protein